MLWYTIYIDTDGTDGALSVYHIPGLIAHFRETVFVPTLYIPFLKDTEVAGTDWLFKSALAKADRPHRQWQN